jgi:hypothetical protein
MANFEATRPVTASRRNRVARAVHLERPIVGLPAMDRHHGPVTIALVECAKDGRHEKFLPWN